MLTGDSLLCSWFPHQTVPTHVWIDSNSKVFAITSGSNATAEHITSFLTGQPTLLSEQKMLPTLPEDFPLIMAADSNTLNNNKFYSYLLPAVGVYGVVDHGMMITPGSPTANRIILNNADIIELLQVAYAEGHDKYGARNSIILEVKDPSKYQFPENDNLFDEWYKSNSYCYEIKVPPAQASSIYKIMQKQLITYFNVTVKKEKRMIKCLVLQKIGKDNLLRSKGGKFDSNFSKVTNDSIRYFKNAPFEYFSSLLEYVFKAYNIGSPFIDATNIMEKIDIKIPSSAWEDLPDYKSLNPALIQYGLQIREKSYMTNVLVIRENNLTK